MEKNTVSIINFRELSEKETYFARTFTVLLVLNGSVTVTQKNNAVFLTAGDLYSINLNQLVTLDASQSTLLFLQIDSFYFASQFPNFFKCSFDCSPALAKHGKKDALIKLRTALAELALNEFNDAEEKNVRHTLGLNKIILLLIQSFQLHTHPAISVGNFKLQQILEYLEEQYANGISLKKVAEHFYLSESVLSKLFKQETGELFSDYLKQLQIYHSLPELLYSQKSIEEVALNCGFNSSKSYREQFKKILALTPRQYRNQQLAQQQPTEVTNTKTNQTDLLVALYSFAQPLKEEPVLPPLTKRHKQLFIETAPSGTAKERPMLIIHISALTDLNQQKIQQEILELHQQHLVQCISFYQIFPIELTDYIAAKRAQLNSFPLFESLDTALAFIEKLQLTIMFHAPIEQEIFQDPQTTMLYRHFFQHIQTQYPPAFFSRWQINIQFQPQAFAKQRHLFKQLVTQFKQLSEQLKIGIQLPIPDPYETMQTQQLLYDFHRFYQERCDFVTFSIEPNFIFNQATIQKTIQQQHYYAQQKTQLVTQLLKEHQFKKPIYLVEWNTLTGTTIHTNGLFFRGAILVSDLLALSKQVTGFGFWLNISAYEENKQTSLLDSEGLELFHYFSNPRPAYFCLLLSQRQQGEIIASADSFLLTKQDTNYQLLIWNPNYFDPHLSSKEAFLASQALQLDISIKGIASGTYQLKHWELDRNHGALFYTYNTFVQAKQLDLETHQYIKQQTQPQLNVLDIAITDVFQYYLTLNTNAVVLLELNLLH